LIAYASITRRSEDSGNNNESAPACRNTFCNRNPINFYPNRPEARERVSDHVDGSGDDRLVWLPELESCRVEQCGRATSVALLRFSEALIASRFKVSPKNSDRCKLSTFAAVSKAKQTEPVPQVRESRNQIRVRNTDGSKVFRERTALLRESLAGSTKPGDETVTLFADGRAVEIPVVCSGLQVPPNRVSQRSFVLTNAHRGAMWTLWMIAKPTRAAFGATRVAFDHSRLRGA
jgi:hypothetical protein